MDNWVFGALNIVPPMTYSTSDPQKVGFPWNYFFP